MFKCNYLRIKSLIYFSLIPWNAILLFATDKIRWRRHFGIWILFSNLEIRTKEKGFFIREMVQSIQCASGEFETKIKNTSYVFHDFLYNIYWHINPSVSHHEHLDTTRTALSRLTDIINLPTVTCLWPSPKTTIN